VINACQIKGPFFDDHNSPTYNYVCVEPFDWICGFFSPSDIEPRMCEFYMTQLGSDGTCTCDEAIAERWVEEVLKEL